MKTEEISAILEQRDCSALRSNSFSLKKDLHVLNFSLSLSGSRPQRYGYQKFEMSFGVKPTHFQCYIDTTTSSDKRIEIRKKIISGQFGHFYVFTESFIKMRKVSSKESSKNEKKVKIIFGNFYFCQSFFNFYDYYMKKHLF